MYVDFKAGNKEYKLRLTTRNVVALEKQLNCNPLAIFGAGDTIPTITTMVQILHASLQPYHHGITLNDAYDIFDAYLEDGHMSTDFITIIVDIYKASGIMKEDKKDTEEESTEKN
jgi:hypothetical protein